MSKKKKNSFILYIIAIALTIALVYLYFKPIEPAHLTTTTEHITISQAVTETETESTTQQELSFNDANEVKSYIQNYANEKGYDFNDYPEKLFELAVKDKTAIPFILDYPAEIKKEHPVPNIDANEITDKVPLFLQWDKRWGYHSFKNGVVGIDGCGAACFSMVAVYLTKDTSITTDAISDYVADNGYFVNGSGMSWDFFTKGIKHYDLKSKSISNNETAMKESLDNNAPIIASVGPGDFTRKGHYIVIAGYDDNGFIINDPFSLVNSQKRWDFATLKPQIRTMWGIYK